VVAAVRLGVFRQIKGMVDPEGLAVAVDVPVRVLEVLVPLVRGIPEGLVTVLGPVAVVAVQTQQAQMEV
jgi:hypothetical protein